jgi:uncharacterized protein (TIGR00255 family)
MISMTGYAFQEKAGQDFSVSAEIKGYNSRFLDISINLPPFLSMFEGEIRRQINSCCGRGKIDVFIRVWGHNIPVNIKVNINTAKAYYDAINNLAKELALEEKCAVSTLLGMEGVIETEKNHDIECYWQKIDPLMQETVKLFCLEREREGKHTREDIIANLEKIEASLKTVKSFIPVIEKTLKENIKARFSELLMDKVDENRILAETASLLLKYTISEEISRLSSHLGEFRAETEKNSRPGKKLDFLSQEINREINTIGSKSAIVEVSGEVVRMKESLENIREQLRNIE